jgi:hypothetical protein
LPLLQHLEVSTPFSDSQTAAGPPFKSFLCRSLSYPL